MRSPCAGSTSSQVMATCCTPAAGTGKTLLRTAAQPANSSSAGSRVRLTIDSYSARAAPRSSSSAVGRLAEPSKSKPLTTAPSGRGSTSSASTAVLDALRSSTRMAVVATRSSIVTSTPMRSIRSAGEAPPPRVVDPLLRHDPDAGAVVVGLGEQARAGDEHEDNQGKR
jgi:hypothetical protein